MAFIARYKWVLVIAFFVWLGFVFYQMHWASDIWEAIKSLHGG